MQLIDLTGRDFGRLRVTGIGGAVNGKRRWYCKCSCGKSLLVDGDSLRSAVTRSCGCLLRERAGETRAERNRTHGQSRTRAHVTWKAMKARCRNEKSTQWKHYGGVGVSVCDRWVNSFENFIADMGQRPQGMSLDRINPFGNYEPGNCRWATPKQQAQNRRKTTSEVRNGSH